MNSDNAGVWVLEWLAMQHEFTRNPPGTVRRHIFHQHINLLYLYFILMIINGLSFVVDS